MAQQSLEFGTAPEGADGDDARTAFTKTNLRMTSGGEPRWGWSNQSLGSLMLGLDPGTGPEKQLAYWAPEDQA